MVSIRVYLYFSQQSDIESLSYEEGAHVFKNGGDRQIIFMSGLFVFLSL